MKEKIKRFFNELDYQNLSKVDEFYDEQIHFEDPLGSLQGLENMKAYYEKLYKNVIQIQFEFEEILEEDLKFFAAWTMNFQARGLKGGKEISVKGGSLIHFSAQTRKALYHRDYFDMGEFIYEQLPVFKSLIGFVKKRLKH